GRAQPLRHRLRFETLEGKTNAVVVAAGPDRVRAGGKHRIALPEHGTALRLSPTRDRQECKHGSEEEAAHGVLPPAAQYSIVAPTTGSLGSHRPNRYDRSRRSRSPDPRTDAECADRPRAARALRRARPRGGRDGGAGPAAVRPG